MLESVSSHSVTCCLEKETSPHLATTTFQEVVESDKVTSESPFLQAKHPQLPQPFLTGFVFQAPHQPRCPPLDVLKHLNVLPKLRDPELDTILKVWPHQCRVQGKYDLPAPAGHAIPDRGQDAIGLLGLQGTLLAHVLPVVNQYPQVSFCLDIVQPHLPQPITLQGVIGPKCRTRHLDVINFILLDTAHPSNHSRPLWKSPPSFQQINTHSQLSVMCKFTNQRFNTLIHVINKNMEQNWPQHRPLRDTTSD
ncbi:hypothetical protein DUI87_20736 [Hirundo rustica rustica]|uniref:Uncharacterized protein n=1 Tax=Hirundo rustica rustica TaxID=333673 RepID=A0A3M0JRD1_HIRRU|nr:hypothetical protein DUI87_20736 [Hirundo rustica rustica]